MLLAGCGSTDEVTQSSRRDRTPTLPPVAPCPTVSPDAASTVFPRGEPALLPHPDFATDATQLPVEVEGVELMEFTTAMSLPDAVRFVTEEYPSAGWNLLEGDVEGREADIPFARGDVHGKLRLRGVEDCTTSWLIATVSRVDVSLDELPELETSVDRAESDH